jgi:hypothetical protein
VISHFFVQDCGITDEIMAGLLESFIARGLKSNTYRFRSLICISNNFGPKCISKIQQLMPNMFQLELTNSTKSLTTDQMHELLTICDEKGKLLQ